MKLFSSISRTLKIKAKDQLVDARWNLGNTLLDNIVPTDINKIESFEILLELFEGAKVMLRYNIDITKRLVNGEIGFVIEIISHLFCRDQV